MTVSNEMSPVRQCDVNHCTYNVKLKCHAKAITIGHAQVPGCDTFLLASSNHNKETKRTAGVGACKVSVCKYNEDFECNANKIAVGLVNDKIKCLTFEKRSESMAS